MLKIENIILIIGSLIICLRLFNPVTNRYSHIFWEQTLAQILGIAIITVVLYFVITKDKKK